MRAHNGRNLAPPSTQVDRVVDLNQIYARKPAHNKSTSLEQSNFHSVGSLQLQVRGSPKQQSQLPARKQAFQLKQPNQLSSPAEKQGSPEPHVERRADLPSASRSAQHNGGTPGSGTTSAPSSGKPPIGHKSGERSQ